MAQIPIILPIVVTGVLVGSLLKSKSRTIPRKKLAIASALSGLLNAGYAYLSYLLTPEPTFRGITVRPVSELAYVVSSFVVGILIVLAVVGVGLVYARFRKEEHEIESEDLTLKGESK